MRHITARHLYKKYIKELRKLQRGCSHIDLAKGTTLDGEEVIVCIRCDKIVARRKQVEENKETDNGPKESA